MARVPESQRGPFTPMRFEATIRDCLVVDGELPKALNGGFYRNGPTWRRPSKQGLESAYTIDGMMQGLIFRDGDRKSVVSGKSVSVRVDLGGRRIIEKKMKK